VRDRVLNRGTELRAPEAQVVQVAPVDRREPRVGRGNVALAVTVAPSGHDGPVEFTEGWPQEALRRNCSGGTI
jgi:hypothetical protein